MSDHLLTGLAPTSPEGRELLFWSSDTWLDLCDGMVALAPRANFSADPGTPEGALALATLLRTALQDGSARDVFLSLPFDASDAGTTEEEILESRKRHADALVWWCEKLVRFLQASGGVDGI